MQRGHGPAARLAALGALLSVVACSDSTGPDPNAAFGSLGVRIEVDGWGQAGVVVEISAGGSALSQVTDSEGLALFNTVPVGRYSLTLARLDPDARMSGSSPSVLVNEGFQSTIRLEGEFDPGRFVAVGVGGAFICGLNENGNAYCWGLGESGELGTGSTGFTGVPGRVRSPVRFVDLATGFFHNCGLSDAGAAWCWGSNGSGRLGRGLSRAQLPWSAQPGLVVGGVAFDDLEAGSSSTCGTERGTGLVLCWGSGSSGFLGTGDGASTSLPRRVASTERFVGLSANDAWAGDRAVAARTEDGRVFLWGAVPSSGPSWINFASPTPMEVPLPAAAIQSTSLCALLVDERVFCWPNLDRAVPAEVLAQLEPTDEPGLFRYLPEGLDPLFLTAGLPCRLDGGGFVCLRDFFQERPPLDFAGEDLVSVSSRGYNGCAVTDLGRIYCWDELFFSAVLVAGPGS